MANLAVFRCVDRGFVGDVKKDSDLCVVLMGDDDENMMSKTNDVVCRMGDDNFLVIEQSPSVLIVAMANKP